MIKVKDINNLTKKEDYELTLMLKKDKNEMIRREQNERIREYLKAKGRI
ncbi:MAG: hypothetical protein ACOC33_00590 [bacterium]